MSASATTSTFANPARFSADHPMRPPEWRWERAADLVRNEQQAVAGEDDDWVTKAYYLYKDLRDAQDDKAYSTALRLARSVGLAYEFWDERPGAVTGGTIAKAEIEARILARQDLPSIAHHFATTADVINAYCNIFFDVADRLDNDGYIRAHVIGGAIHGPLADKDFRILLRAYGYNYQIPDLVTALSSTFSPERFNTGTVEECLNRDTRFTMELKSSLAARMLPLNQFTQIPLLQIKQQQQLNDQGVAPAGELHSMLQIVLGELRFTRDAPGNPCGIVEPRAAQLLAETLGAHPVIIDQPAAFPVLEKPEAKK